MNKHQLEEPPKDLTGYITAKEFGSLEHNENNLRELIKQGTSNIIAKKFSFASITDLETTLADHGYKICFMTISGSTAFADFYLIKF